MPAKWLQQQKTGTPHTTDQTSKVQIWSIIKRKTTARHQNMDGTPNPKNITPEKAKEIRSARRRSRPPSITPETTGSAHKNRPRSRGENERKPTTINGSRPVHPKPKPNTGLKKRETGST